MGRLRIEGSVGPLLTRQLIAVVVVVPHSINILFD